MKKIYALEEFARKYASVIDVPESFVRKHMIFRFNQALAFLGRYSDEFALIRLGNEYIDRGSLYLEEAIRKLRLTPRQAARFAYHFARMELAEIVLSRSVPYTIYDPFPVIGEVLVSSPSPAAQDSWWAKILTKAKSFRYIPDPRLMSYFAKWNVLTELFLDPISRSINATEWAKQGKLLTDDVPLEVRYPKWYERRQYASEGEKIVWKVWDDVVEEFIRETASTTLSGLAWNTVFSFVGGMLGKVLSGSALYSLDLFIVKFGNLLTHFQWTLTNVTEWHIEWYLAVGEWSFLRSLRDHLADWRSFFDDWAIQTYENAYNYYLALNSMLESGYYIQKEYEPEVEIPKTLSRDSVILLFQNGYKVRDHRIKTEHEILTCLVDADRQLFPCVSDTSGLRKTYSFGSRKAEGRATLENGQKQDYVSLLYTDPFIGLSDYHQASDKVDYLLRFYHYLLQYFFSSDEYLLSSTVPEVRAFRDLDEILRFERPENRLYTVLSTFQNFLSFLNVYYTRNRKIVRMRKLLGLLLSHVSETPEIEPKEDIEGNDKELLLAAQECYMRPNPFFTSCSRLDDLLFPKYPAGVQWYGENFGKFYLLSRTKQKTSLIVLGNYAYPEPYYMRSVFKTKRQPSLFSLPFAVFDLYGRLDDEKTYQNKIFLLRVYQDYHTTLGERSLTFEKDISTEEYDANIRITYTYDYYSSQQLIVNNVIYDVDIRTSFSPTSSVLRVFLPTRQAKTIFLEGKHGEICTAILYSPEDKSRVYDHVVVRNLKRKKDPLSSSASLYHDLLVYTTHQPDRRIIHDLHNKGHNEIVSHILLTHTPDPKKRYEWVKKLHAQKYFALFLKDRYKCVVRYFEKLKRQEKVIQTIKNYDINGNIASLFFSYVQIRHETDFNFDQLYNNDYSKDNYKSITFNLRIFLDHSTKKLTKKETNISLREYIARQPLRLYKIVCSLS